MLRHVVIELQETEIGCETPAPHKNQDKRLGFAPSFSGKS